MALINARNAAIAEKVGNRAAVLRRPAFSAFSAFLTCRFAKASPHRLFGYVALGQIRSGMG